MNTITISEEIDWMDFCPTETSTQITNIVPRTEPLLSSAFIENARDRGTDVDADVVRQRVIDLLKQGEYSQGEIYARVHSRASSTKSFKFVSSMIQDMLDSETITIVETEYARKYTLSEIKYSARQEIKERGQIAEEYKRWIPIRWR